jgi:hypothetical protein
MRCDERRLDATLGFSRAAPDEAAPDHLTAFELMVSDVALRRPLRRRIDAGEDPRTLVETEGPSGFYIQAYGAAIAGLH